MSQSIRQQRLARLNDTLAAWLAAQERSGGDGPTGGDLPPDAATPTLRVARKVPHGYHALPTPHDGERDGLADDPRLARTAFVRAFVTQALLAAQQQAATTPRAQLRGLARARGLLLYRIARARHAAGKPLPLNPLWRDRPATDGTRGRARRVPAWALEPLGTARHQRAAGDSGTPPPPSPAPYDPTTDPFADPNNELIANPNTTFDLGDGVTLSGDEVQALWDAFVADPQGVLGAADAGDWVSLDEATAFFTDFARDPIGMVARYGGADGLMRYVTGQLAADPQALWDHLLTSVGPSLALGGAEGDALAFWATNGEMFDLTNEEIAAAQAGGPNAPTAAETDQIALSDADIQYPYPDHLLAEGAVMSDLTIAQLLNSYWAQQDAQTAGQIALGDAGVPAGIVSSFDLVNPAMTDFLRQQAGALVTGIDERTRALLGDALWNAYSGINFAALPRDYRMADYLRNYLNLFNNDLQGMSRQRALLIARTEGARAANFGNMVAFARLGVRYLRWVTNAGACLICLGNGEVDYVPYGSDFPSGVKSPPQHPLCLVAGTPVLTDQGEIPIEDVRLGMRVWTHKGRWREVVGTVKAQYAGPIIRLHLAFGQSPASAGQWVTRTIELTPDHPLQTAEDISQRHGITTDWVVARDIDERAHRFIAASPGSGFEVVSLDAPPVSYMRACTVYNLEVEEDHTYVAAGIVSSNCRCAIGPYVPDTFDPNDWTSLPLSPDDVAAMLFNPDYGAFPASPWPITAADAAAPTTASASDLGLLDTSSMSPDLQSVLTPDAIASLQSALSGAADDAAQGWLDDQGLPMPQSESGFTYYFDPEGADAEAQMNPDTLTRIRASFGQAVDDWYASMQGGDAEATDEGDVEGE